MVVLTPKDHKGLTKGVSQIAAQLRKSGCTYVLDEQLQEHSTCAKRVHVHCINRFAQIRKLVIIMCSYEHMDSVDVKLAIGFKH